MTLPKAITTLLLSTAALLPASRAVAVQPPESPASKDLGDLLPRALTRLGLPSTPGAGSMNGADFPIAVVSGKIDVATLAAGLRRELGPGYTLHEERSLGGPMLLVAPRPLPWESVGFMFGRAKGRLRAAYAMSVIDAGPGSQILVATPMAPVVALFERPASALYPYSGALLAHAKMDLRGTLDLDYRFGGIRIHAFQGDVATTSADAWAALDAGLTAQGLWRLPRGPTPLAASPETRAAVVLGSSGSELYLASDMAASVHVTDNGDGRASIEVNETTGRAVEPGPHDVAPFTQLSPAP